MLGLVNISWLDVKNRIDFTNIRILEQIYIPKTKAITLMELSDKLKKYKINKMKISRRLRSLKDMGLVNVIEKTNPLCIWGIWEIEEKIKYIIIENKNKLGIV